MLDDKQITSVIYINGNTCLPCIQPEIEKLKLDSNTWVALHPKIDFLKNSFLPRVWVDWQGDFSKSLNDSAYFQVFTKTSIWQHVACSSADEAITVLYIE